MQKRQIIPIVRANEILIARLLDAGILYISEEDNMIHVTEDWKPEIKLPVVCAVDVNVMESAIIIGRNSFIVVLIGLIPFGYERTQ